MSLAKAIQSVKKITETLDQAEALALKQHPKDVVDDIFKIIRGHIYIDNVHKIPKNNHTFKI